MTLQEALHTSLTSQALTVEMFKQNDFNRVYRAKRPSVKEIFFFELGLPFDLAQDMLCVFARAIFLMPWRLAPTPTPRRAYVRR